MSVFLHRYQIWSPDQGKRVIPDEIEDFHKDCLKRTVKFPKGIMVWGCMTAKGLGTMKFIVGTVDTANIMKFFIPHYHKVSQNCIQIKILYFNRRHAIRQNPLRIII